MSRTGRRTGVTAIVVALAIGCSIAAAAAPETLTRPEYVSQLEEVCKPGAKATQRAMEGVREDVRHHDRIPVAAKKFEQAAHIFGGTIKEISHMPRPAGDGPKLREWFVYLNRQEDYLQEIAGQLRQGRTIKAQRLTARFIHNGNLANNVTLAFGFDYCSFKFSRYG